MEQVGRLGDRLNDSGCVGVSPDVAYPAVGCIRSLLVLVYLCSSNKQLNGSLAISLYTGHTVFSCSSPVESGVACKVLSSGIHRASL